MKSVNVVAAVMCDKYEEKTKIFATQRGYGEYKDGLEFPGEKRECRSILFSEYRHPGIMNKVKKLRL